MTLNCKDEFVTEGRVQICLSPSRVLLPKHMTPSALTMTRDAARRPSPDCRRPPIFDQEPNKRLLFMHKPYNTQFSTSCSSASQLTQKCHVAWGREGPQEGAGCEHTPASPLAPGWGDPPPVFRESAPSLVGCIIRACVTQGERHI